MYTEIVSIIDADTGEPLDFSVDELGVDLNTSDPSANFSASEVTRELQHLQKKYDHMAGDKVRLINVLSVIGNQTIEQRETLQALKQELLDKKTRLLEVQQAIQEQQAKSILNLKKVVTGAETEEDPNPSLVFPFIGGLLLGSFLAGILSSVLAKT